MTDLPYFPSLPLSVQTHEILFYTLGYSPILLCFVAQVVLALAIKLFLCLYDIFHCYHLLSFFQRPFLLSDTVRCFKLIMYFLPCLRISHSSQEAPVLLIGKAIRNEYLVARCVLCYWCVFRFQVLSATEWGNIPVFTKPCIYV